MARKKKFMRLENRGFMLIQCQKRGETRAFYTRDNLEEYRCRACGEYTPLERLGYFIQECPCCEETHRYMTNVQDDVLTLNCISCGAPVDIEWDGRRRHYVTITEKDYRRRSKRRRR